MKKVKSKNYIIIFIVLIIILISSISTFYNNYNLFKSPPSNLWSKEVLVGNGEELQKPKIIEFDGKNIISYNKLGVVYLKKIDSKGKIIKEINIPTEDNFILDINLLTDGNDIFVNWIKSKNGVKYIENYKFNKELSKIDYSKVENVSYSKQIDEDSFIIAKKGSLEYKNIKNNQNLSIPVDTEISCGIKLNGDVLVATLRDQVLSCINIKSDGSFNIDKLGEISRDSKISINNIAINKDKNNIYALIESSYKDDNGRLTEIVYNLDTKKSETKAFKLYGRDKFFSPVAIPSKDSARFLVVTSIPKKLENTDNFGIVDITLDDNNLINATRVDGSCDKPFYNNGFMIFKNISDGKENVYVESTKDDFKNTNNVVTKEEWNTAVGYTASKIFTGIFMGFIQGLKWILPGFLIIGIISFVFVDKYQEEYKKKGYIATYLGIVIIKVITLYNYLYKQDKGGLIGALGNSALGLVIMIGISIIMFLFSYGLYKKDVSKLPIFSFLAGIGLDTLLTSIIFMPYVI